MNGFTKRAVVLMMAATMTFTSGGAFVYADEISDAAQTATEAVQTADEVTQTTDEITQTTDEVTEEAATDTTQKAEETQKTEVTTSANYVKICKAYVYSKKVLKNKYRIASFKWKAKVTVVSREKYWTTIKYNGKTAYMRTNCLAYNPIVIKYTDKSYIRYAKKKINIYRTPSLCSSAYKTKYKVNSKLTCVGTCGYFTVVKKGNSEVFVKTAEIQSTKVKVKKTTYSKTGASVAKYAKKFKGNPYKWGGTSLTHGADCSGFTKSVFKKFGVKLPHSSSAQRHYGRRVSLKNAKAGDLVCYSGHVGIYIGHGKIIHASNPRGGIKISSVHIMKIVTIRRLV